MEALLLCPSPVAIREAETALGEAAALVFEQRDALEGEMQGANLLLLKRFEVLSRRVAALLEGARRAQWIRLRRITALTHTYTAGAESKMCTSQRATVNVRM